MIENKEIFHECMQISGHYEVSNLDPRQCLGVNRERFIRRRDLRNPPSNGMNIEQMILKEHSTRLQQCYM
jgi:hypothetical protein